ncbi:thioredoxin-like protein [Dichotomocladium elegans]|nr:thioredoxin-like protein [Dichotomocladium elegans]
MQLGHIFALLACAIGLCWAQVIQVTDSNVKSLITDDSEWLLEFYADWCGYCTRYAPSYEAAEDALSSMTAVRVGKVNVEQSPGLAARFFVQRLPTVVHIKNHEVRAVPLDQMNDLVNFVKDEAWKDIQPANGLTSPFSAIGSMVAVTGRMVRWASSMSPFTIAVLMVVLLGLVVVLPLYMPQQGDEQTVPSPAAAAAAVVEGATESESSAAGKTTATIASSSPSTKQRKSKRID